jgi:SEC-C motif
MDTEEARDVLVQAARRALVECGPLGLDELAAVLTGGDFALDANLVDQLPDVLLDEEWPFDLSDGRMVDLERLLDGLTLTHRLGEDEASGEFVMVEPDLSPLLVVPAEELTLADGGAAWLSFPGGHGSTVDSDHPLAGECLLVGSPGWLGDAAAGDLLAFRLDGDRLHVDLVDRELTDSTEVTKRLASTFDEVSEDGEPIESCDLILAALADAPELFSSPLPPLGQLYADIGLETCAEWVGVDGEDWSRFEEDMTDEITALSQQLWGLGEMESQALGILLGVCGLVANTGTAELTADPQMVAALSHMLSLQGVAEAFSDTMLNHGLDHEPGAIFVQALADAGGGSVGVHYALSRYAEHRGDALAGEAHLAAALAIDPEFEPALIDAAWYAEDRGDAARALKYLRQIGIDEEQTLLLERFAARGPAAARRNDACPCGSGRKYKTCCSRHNGHLLPERAGWLRHKASAFLFRPAQRLVLREIALARTGSDPDDTDWIDAALYDPLTQDLTLFDTDVFASFLDVRGELLPADELELGRSWVGLARSLYEVKDVSPGEGMQLRDLRTGERLDVTERSGSQDLAPGTLLYARVAPDGRSHLLLGGTMTIPFTLRDRLLALLDTEPGPEEVAAWFAAAEAPPTLANREAEIVDVDGDHFVEHVEVDG